jgi:carboxymethylenebutenolidase
MQQAAAGVDRREFLVNKLSAGFAMAVLPVSAQTITTDTDGLEAGEVSIPTGDGRIPAYRAMPKSGKSFPDVISKVVSKVPDTQVMSDLDAAVEWAGKTGKGDVGRLGITGFCWGGRIVWLYAAHSPKLKAGVAWYGRIVGQANELQPKYPIDVAGALKAPVLGLYGGKDQGIPLDTLEQMRAALKAAGNPSEIVVYPEAGHGFNADYRPGYDKEAAQDGWKRLQQWFKKYGAA